MKIAYLLSGLLLLALASCTPVTTTNLPGEKLDKIPKNLLGTFELQYPGDLAELTSDPAAKTYVTIKSDRILMTDQNGDSETMLGDSLYFSKIGKQVYLSMGERPDFTVFKVVKKGKDIQLFCLYSDNAEIGSSELSPFFSTVTEIQGEPDENGEPGMTSYRVTVDDKKLASYFESEIPMADPFILKKSSGKK